MRVLRRTVVESLYLLTGPAAALLGVVTAGAALCFRAPVLLRWSGGLERWVGAVAVLRGARGAGRCCGSGSGKAGKAKFGYANSFLYTVARSSSYGTDFHDVKSGNNGGYSAGTGYDEVTGWGSYNGAQFIANKL